MKNLEFPIIGTRIKSLTKKFDLNSPAGRKKYFEAKVGDEIKQIKKYLKNNTFIAYLLGKKNSGKGTYTKIMTEIFGEDKIAHLSVGDVVRGVHNDIETSKGKKLLNEYLSKNYRGYISIEKGMEAILNRSQDKVSVPTELLLSLVKREIDKHFGKVIFLDGFPRTMDQVSYSLYFRDLINYRDDPDLFILIDIPESVIEARMLGRVVCPKCKIPRHPKLFVTSKIEYDAELKEFYLLCDNPNCKGARMVGKEGDEAGLESIRARLNQDEDLIRTSFDLHGVPKILLRNHVPVSSALKQFDTYELTPEYSFSLEKSGEVKVHEKEWVVKDDNGVDCHSLLAPTVVVSMIKQLVEVLDL
jgi:adenylate kinase family enzyme